MNSRRPCAAIFMTPVIQWSGKVTTCCYDPELELEIGNIHKSSLKDLWYGPEMQKRRALQIKGDFTYPKKCFHCKNVDGIQITDDEIIKYLDDADRLDLVERYIERMQLDEASLKPESRAIIKRTRSMYNLETLKEEAKNLLKAELPERVCAGFWASPTVNWNGEVTVCCKDGYLELSAGNLINNPFSKLWWGNPILIRRRFQHIRRETDQIPLCKDCDFQADLKTLQFKEVEIRDYLNAFIQDKPFQPQANFLTIELTNTCNMKCIMCPQAEHNEWNYKHADPFFGFLSFANFKKMLKNLEGQHFCDLVLFWFGEPLLNPDLPGILEALYEHNESHHLFNNLIIHTNGLLLTKNVSDFLLKTKSRLIIHFSIDAANEVTYNSIRKNSNFKKVIENVKYFLISQKKNQKVESALQFIVMEYNKDEAKEFLAQWNEFGKQNGIDFKIATRYNWPEGHNHIIFFRNLAAQSVIMDGEKMSIPSNNLELYDSVLDGLGLK